MKKKTEIVNIQTSIYTCTQVNTNITIVVVTFHNHRK